MAKVNDNNYPLTLTLASLTGLVAAFWQAAERVHMLRFPADPLNCNLSPVVDCGSVLGDKLSSVFGPPNALIGVVAFSLLLAFGLQRLSGGQWSRLSRKIVLGLSLIMILFSLWFFWVSLFVLGKICLFCIFIWAASIPIGVYGVKDFLDSSYRLSPTLTRIKEFIAVNYLIITVAVYLIMIGLFLLRFQEYYF